MGEGPRGALQEVALLAERIGNWRVLVHIVRGSDHLCESHQGAPSRRMDEGWTGWVW